MQVNHSRLSLLPLEEQRLARVPVSKHQERGTDAVLQLGKVVFENVSVGVGVVVLKGENPVEKGQISGQKVDWLLFFLAVGLNDGLTVHQSEGIEIL